MELLDEDAPGGLGDGGHPVVVVLQQHGTVRHGQSWLSDLRYAAPELGTFGIFYFFIAKNEFIASFIKLITYLCPSPI